MAVSLVACGGGDKKDAAKKSDSESKKSTNTDVLNINLASEPAYLDPALNSSVDGGCLAVNSFVGLYTYDKDGKLVPALSDGEPEISEDKTTYTFKLIESKWSDGSELTAKDFAYSWNRAAAEATASDYSYLFDVIDKNDDGTLKVTADDDYTLTVQLASPCAYFLDLCAFPTFMPVPQASVEAADKDGSNPGAWAQEAGFVCNGAYTLDKWSHNESMVYVKNDNYYDAKNVTMKELHFMLSDDMTAVYAAYNSGDLDYIDSVPNDEIPSLNGVNPEFGILDNLGTYYAWQGLYDYTWPNATDAGAFVDKLENRKVTWEKNGNLNAGIEATMFGGRLGVSVEYYNRKTRDMLLNSPLPISTGFTGFNDNVGSLRNQGLEVSLRGTILDKRDFRWDATLMGSFNRNKVLSLTGGQDVITSGIRVIEVGRPIYTFYLPKTAGVDPATGKQLYYAYWTQTVNDEGALVNTRCDEYITDNVAMATLSKYYHESREPKLFGSIGSTFTILKNIDVSFLTTYSIGGWVYDGLYNGSMYVQYAGNNWHKNAKRRWQKPGDKTDVPMLEVGGSYATASNSLIDASYFAIKNITVGYTLPKRWLKKIDIESLRIYATLDNIAMFNHMDGMDPQYNFTGSVAYSYTPSRVIAFGIDLNF